MKTQLLILILISLLGAQNGAPASFWSGYSQDEKIAFINGVYGAISKLKSHHRSEVRKQFHHETNWVEPYYIERFYEIIDEHRAKKAGYQVNLIAQALDAFYSNYDNTAIPLLEAVRIVSLAQDEETEKADLYLLKAQKRYRP